MIEISESDIIELVPFCDLDAGDRVQIAKQARRVLHLQGEIIYPAELSETVCYLLQGQLELHDQFLPVEFIDEQSVQSLRPVFNEVEEQQTHVVLLTDCEFCEIDRALFNRMIEQEVLVDEHMFNRHIGHVENSLYNEILLAVENHQLVLPSLPEIALRIKKAIESSEADIKQISKIVELDPALSARLIKVSNSVLHRGNAPIKTMRDVIVRLGLKVTRNLVMSFCMAQLFKTKTPMLKKKMQQFYAHSVEIASIAHALGEHIDTLEPDQLLLAGLIHDIGVIPIISYIEKTGLTFNNEDEIDQLIRSLRVATGVLVVKSWDLPLEMLNVVTHAEHWYRDNGDNIQLADAVVIAQLYDMIRRDDARRMPDLKRVPALKKLRVGDHDPALVLEILDQAKEEINAVQELLSA